MAILEANPLQDICNTERIVAVISEGRYRLVNDFLETSGIVFGIRDASVPNATAFVYGEQHGNLQYIAEQTGGQYFSVPESLYATALKDIIFQLHFRYQIGFVPPELDRKRHQLKVEFTDEARKKYRSVRLRYRREYIPNPNLPSWAR
jgi:hypothetical protein